MCERDFVAGEMTLPVIIHVSGIYFIFRFNLKDFHLVYKISSQPWQQWSE